MTYIPPTEEQKILNKEGVVINPATEETINLLRRIVKLLEPLATVDSSNRQRIVTESGSVVTASLASSQTLATLTTITNAVPVGNVATLSGIDPKFEFMELARISYSNGIRSKLNFS